MTSANAASIWRRAALAVAHAASGNPYLRSRLTLLGAMCALIAAGTGSALVLEAVLTLNPPTLLTVAGRARTMEERCTRQGESPPSCRSLTLYFELDAPAVAGTRFARGRGEAGFAALRRAVSQASVLRLEYYEADCGIGPTCWPVGAFAEDGPLFVADGEQRRRAALLWLVGICALSATIMVFCLSVRRAGKAPSADS